MTATITTPNGNKVTTATGRRFVVVSEDVNFTFDFATREDRIIGADRAEIVVRTDSSATAHKRAKSAKRSLNSEWYRTAYVFDTETRTFV